MYNRFRDMQNRATSKDRSWTGRDIRMRLKPQWSKMVTSPVLQIAHSDGRSLAPISCING